MGRLLLTFLFGTFYVGWRRKRSCGALLLDASFADRSGFGFGKFQVSPTAGSLRAAAVALMIVAASTAWLGQPAVAICLGVIAVGTMVLSYWPSRTFAEFREFAAIVESDLPRGPDSEMFEVVDYEWIEDILWDEEGRVSLKLDMDVSPAVPSPFVRVRIPQELRGRVSSILLERMGKSRKQLEEEFPSGR